MGKALYEESIENDGLLQVCSMYDKQQDAFNNPYFPAENFRGFGINKLQFIKQMVQAGFKYDRVILSHINLLPVGWLIKKLSPRYQNNFAGTWDRNMVSCYARKRKMLHQCDKIIAVSNYTKNKIREVHGIPEKKIAVLNNCLDPFLPLPSLHNKSKRRCLKNMDLPHPISSS